MSIQVHVRYIHVHTHAYTRTRTTCTYTYTHVHTRIRTHRYTRTYPYTHVHTHVRTHRHTRIYTHRYTHVHTHTRTCQQTKTEDTTVSSWLHCQTHVSFLHVELFGGRPDRNNSEKQSNRRSPRLDARMSFRRTLLPCSSYTSPSRLSLPFPVGSLPPVLPPFPGSSRPRPPGDPVLPQTLNRRRKSSTVREDPCFQSQILSPGGTCPYSLRKDY